MSVEDIINKATDVAKKRDSRIIEVSQAVAAAIEQVNDQTVVDGDVMTVTNALTKFRELAIDFKTGDDIQALKDAATDLFAAEGVRVVDVVALNSAIETAVKEAAEASAANIDEDQSIADLKQLANDYTKEDVDSSAPAPSDPAPADPAPADPAPADPAPADPSQPTDQPAETQPLEAKKAPPAHRGTTKK